MARSKLPDSYEQILEEVEKRHQAKRQKKAEANKKYRAAVKANPSTPRAEPRYTGNDLVLKRKATHGAS